MQNQKPLNQINMQQSKFAVVGLMSDIKGAVPSGAGSWAASNVSMGMVTRAAARNALILLTKVLPSFVIRDFRCFGRTTYACFRQDRSR
jgi:hypothetical protein